VCLRCATSCLGAGNLKEARRIFRKFMGHSVRCGHCTVSVTGAWWRYVKTVSHGCILRQHVDFAYTALLQCAISDMRKGSSYVRPTTSPYRLVFHWTDMLRKFKYVCSRPQMSCTLHEDPSTSLFFARGH